MLKYWSFALAALRPSGPRPYGQEAQSFAAPQAVSESSGFPVSIISKTSYKVADTANLLVVEIPRLL